MNKEQTNTTNKNPRLSACTEAYKEHIMYTFNAFCKVVIRYATINSWRDRSPKLSAAFCFQKLSKTPVLIFSTFVPPKDESGVYPWRIILAMHIPMILFIHLSHGFCNPTTQRNRL